MAWLHASDERSACDFPELEDYAEWVVQTAFGIGLSNGSNPMGGVSPLTYTDLLSWCQLSSVQLDAFESELIRNLSQIYCTCLSNYKDDCAPPYESEETRINRIKSQESLMKTSFLKRVKK